MKYRVRGKLFVIDPLEEFKVDYTIGIPCNAIVEASSKEEAEEKGLKQLKKELGDYIKIIEVQRLGKNNSELCLD